MFFLPPKSVTVLLRRLLWRDILFLQNVPTSLFFCESLHLSRNRYNLKYHPLNLSIDVDAVFQSPVTVWPCYCWRLKKLSGEPQRWRGAKGTACYQECQEFGSFHQASHGFVPTRRKDQPSQWPEFCGVRLWRTFTPLVNDLFYFCSNASIQCDDLGNAPTTLRLNRRILCNLGTNLCTCFFHLHLYISLNHKMFTLFDLLNRRAITFLILTPFRY